MCLSTGYALPAFSVPEASSAGAHTPVPAPSSIHPLAPLVLLHLQARSPAARSASTPHSSAAMWGTMLHPEWASRAPAPVPAPRPASLTTPAAALCVSATGYRVRIGPGSQASNAGQPPLLSHTSPALPAARKRCGDTCIDPTTDCCTTDYAVGKICSTDVCATSGTPCATGCPSTWWRAGSGPGPARPSYIVRKPSPGDASAHTLPVLSPQFLPAAGTLACGSVCYNTTTQCCADAATSLIGVVFNGACYAKPLCILT